MNFNKKPLAKSNIVCTHCANVNSLRPDNDQLPTNHFLRDNRDPRRPIVCTVLLNTQCESCLLYGHTRAYCSNVQDRPKFVNRSIPSFVGGKHDLSGANIFLGNHISRNTSFNSGVNRFSTVHLGHTFIPTTPSCSPPPSDDEFDTLDDTLDNSHQNDS
jgi:hypothetical protein